MPSLFAFFWIHFRAFNFMIERTAFWNLWYNTVWSHLLICFLNFPIFFETLISHVKISAILFVVKLFFRYFFWFHRGYFDNNFVLKRLDLIVIEDDVLRLYLNFLMSELLTLDCCEFDLFELIGVIEANLFFGCWFSHVIIVTYVYGAML